MFIKLARVTLVIALLFSVWGGAGEDFGSYSKAYASGTSPVQLDLSPYFNNDAFSYDANRSNGDLDGNGNTISADLVQVNPIYAGAPFTLGPLSDGSQNNIKPGGQIMELDDEPYNSIRVLGAASGTDETGYSSGKFTFVYADGTTSEETLLMLDYRSQSAFDLENQQTVQTMNHHHSKTADIMENARLYQYNLSPEPGKKLDKLILPNNAQLNIFAMTLFVGISVDLFSEYNHDGFSYDTDTHPWRNRKIGDGAYDSLAGSGKTYSANLVHRINALDGVSYSLGLFEDSYDNAVAAVGQTIPLRPDNYSSVQVAGAATAGDKTGTFRILYTDGTYDDMSVTMKDWATANPSGQHILQTLNHRHTGPRGSGSDESVTNYIFVYELAVDTAKSVSGIVLPNEWNMHILAMTLLPGPTGGVVPPAPDPRVMTLTLPSEDVPVAMYSVTDFGAVANDLIDDTAAFQQALDAAAFYGGGVVFAPAGRYVFEGHLSVPELVTLRGEWQNPEQGGLGTGTILMSYENKGNENGAAFISTKQSSTVRDVTIWYPEQDDIGNIQAYPWTIAADLTTRIGPTLKNITLINSYKGFNLFLAACSYSKNIYGTVLKQGFEIDKIGDILRMETVHLRPKYWADSGLGTPPTESSIMAYQRANGTGVVQKKNDWGYMYDVFLEGYGIGLLVEEGIYGKYNGQIQKLRTENGKIGIRLADPSGAGITISNSTINTTGSDGISVEAPSTFDEEAVVFFNSTTFGSPDGIPVKMDGAGTLSFAHATFSDWGSGRAVEASDGTLIITSSVFGVDQPEVWLGSGVSSLTMVGNEFAGNSPDVHSLSSGDIKFNNDARTAFSPQLPAGDPPIPANRKPLTSNFFNVKKAPYNAEADGTTDDTGAIQDALDDAGTAGGGTVYLPAGRYNIAGHLSVPGNVELRGVSDGPYHYGSKRKGTVLLASENQGDESGDPFLALGQDAGVRGLSVFYPIQNFSAPIAYPATIQGNGAGAYVKDVTLPDSYTGIKMNEGDYLIDYVRGVALKTFIDLDGVNGDPGYIRNLMNTVGDWQDAGREDNAPRINWWMNTPSTMATGIRIHNTSHVNVFQSFSYGVGYGIGISGNSSDIQVYGFGADNAEHGVELSGSGTNINFINTQLTAIGGGNKRYINTAHTFTGDVKFFNTIAWAAQNGSQFNGPGSVTLQQYHDTYSGNPYRIRHISGKLWLDSSVFPQVSDQVYISLGAEDAAIFANVGVNGLQVHNDLGDPDVWMNIRK